MESASSYRPRNKAVRIRTNNHTVKNPRVNIYKIY